MEPANNYTQYEGKTKASSRMTMRIKDDHKLTAYYSENNSDVETNTPEQRPRKGVDPKELQKKLSAVAGHHDDQFALDSGNESQNEDRARQAGKGTVTAKPSKFAKMAPVATGELNDEDEEHDNSRPKNVVRTTTGALKKPDEGVSTPKLSGTTTAHPPKFVNKALDAIRRENTTQVTLSDNEASKSKEVRGIGAHPFRHLIFNPSIDENKFRKHLVMVYKGLVYSAKCLKGPSEKFIKAKQVDIKSIANRPKTLCLDLDETMIHTCTMKEKPDVVLTAKDDYGNSVSIPVKIRPFLQEFLKRMSALFDIVVYTAGADYYANAILNYIDPNKTLLSDILSRKNCMETKNGFVIKDLRIIRNRELKDMTIVDNLSHSFGFQIENGIPILEYLEDPNDKELLYLGNYLTELAKAADVREFNKAKLKLFELIEVNEEELFNV